MSQYLGSKNEKKVRVAVVGGGFAGLAAVKRLAKNKNIEIDLIDRNNYHLFQPLLYQVAVGGLNPSDIAVPFRTMFAHYSNVQVKISTVDDIDIEKKGLFYHNKWSYYDYVIMACGSQHFYFSNNQWENFAPGLKTIEQAIEIRKRIFTSIEQAEIESDPEVQKALITFAVIGGGPTGVELAGAIAEMMRLTLYKQYKNVNLQHVQVILIEAGQRILSTFHEELSQKAHKDLEKMGVEIVIGEFAENLSAEGLKVGNRTIIAKNLIWAAGVGSVELNHKFKVEQHKDGRIKVNPDMSIPSQENWFILGDQAAYLNQKTNQFLPGLAPVAIQQGQFTANLIRAELLGKQRSTFHYNDKGTMATIGRSKAIAETKKIKVSGFIAWIMWMVIHISFIVQFKNRVFILSQWIWSFFKFGHGANLIIHNKWQFYKSTKNDDSASYNDLNRKDDA